MVNELEIWKDIPGFPMYQASSFGRIRTGKRIIQKSFFCFGWCKERILDGQLGTDGYLHITVTVYGNHIPTSIHVLVCKAFHANSENLPCVNHKDGNKLNNASNNVEWCTYSYNLQHAWDTGLRKRKYKKAA